MTNLLFVCAPVPGDENDDAEAAVVEDTEPAVETTNEVPLPGDNQPRIDDDDNDDDVQFLHIKWATPSKVFDLTAFPRIKVEQTQGNGDGNADGGGPSVGAAGGSGEEVPVVENSAALEDDGCDVEEEDNGTKKKAKVARMAKRRPTARRGGKLGWKK